MKLMQQEKSCCFYLFHIAIVSNMSYNNPEPSTAQNYKYSKNFKEEITMLNAKEIIQMYNINSEDMEVKLYQAMLDLGMDDDGLIAIVIDQMLAAVYN